MPVIHAAPDHSPALAPAIGLPSSESPVPPGHHRSFHFPRQPVPTPARARPLRRAWIHLRPRGDLDALCGYGRGVVWWDDMAEGVRVRGDVAWAGG